MGSDAFIADLTQVFGRKNKGEHTLAYHKHD